MRRSSVLAAVAALVLLSWWAGCSNPNLAGGKLHFDQATRLEGPEKTARFRRALETFQKAVKELPNDPEARIWLGQTYAELDRPDSASMAFDEAIRLSPGAAMADRIKDVRGHYHSEKYNGAMASAVAAQKERAKENEAGAVAAYRDALAKFRTAAIYKPEDPKTYTMIGKVYLNLAKVDSALVELKRSRELAPNDDRVRDDLFAVYREEGDKAFGVAAEKAGSASTPADSVIIRQNFEDAAELYRQADQVMPGVADLNFQLGATAYELAQLIPEKRTELLNEAAVRYEEVLKQNPVDADVIYNLVLVLRDLKRYDEARERALRLVDLRPREGTYREILGRTEDQLGNKEALLSGLVFGRALKSGTPVPSSEAAAHVEKFGSGTEIKRRYLENGAPEEIYTFEDAQGQAYEAWFYWNRGLGYGFVEGREKFTTKFAPDGTLRVDNAEITTKGTSKFLTGTLSNGSSHRYSVARAEFKLVDDQGLPIGHTHAMTSDLNGNGNWTFEVPLTGPLEKAASATVDKVLGY